MSADCWNIESAWEWILIEVWIFFFSFCAFKSMESEFIDPINHSIEKPGHPRLQAKPKSSAKV